MKRGIVFPGYGSQFTGMGKEFYDRSRSMQERFDEASQCLNVNLVKICFASSETEMSELEKAYVSIFVNSFGIAEILVAKGIVPSVVAGYDIGEWAAAAIGGGISLPDVVYMMKKIAIFYDAMLAQKKVDAVRVFNIDEETLKLFCNRASSGNLASSISSHELENQFVVTGMAESIKELKKILKDEGFLSGQANVGSGLHSPLMDDVVKTVKMYLTKVDFKEMSIPFVASVTGQVLTDGDAVQAAIMQQINSPLRWYETMKAFEHCDQILVVGDCSITKELCVKMFPDKDVQCILKPHDIDMLVGECELPPEEKRSCLIR